MCLFSHFHLIATPSIVAHQAPLSMGFLRQVYWRGLAISSSKGSSPPRDQTQVSCISCIDRQILCHCASREAPQVNRPYTKKQAISLGWKKSEQPTRVGVFLFSSNGDLLGDSQQGCSLENKCKYQQEKDSAVNTCQVQHAKTRLMWQSYPSRNFSAPGSSSPFLHCY